MLLQFLLILMLVGCALYDLVEFRIPNALTAGIVVLFVIWAVAQPFGLWQLAGHVLVGGVVLVCAAILFRFGLVGGGDVKLLAATSLWAGPNIFLAHLLLTSFFAVGLVIVISLARWLYPAVLATIPRIGRVSMPRVLQQGVGIPYGIAIAASAIVLGMPSPS